MYISTGEILDIENRMLYLYEVDLVSNTMSVILSEEGGFPYNTMTAAENRLLMVRVISTGGCVLEEYSTETNERKILKKFDFDDRANVGEAIRQIMFNDNITSLLRLKIEDNGLLWLYIDRYDYDMRYLSSFDVSIMPLTSINETHKNELRQGVTDFILVNNYVYYANFSITRFLGKVENDSLHSIMSVNPEFEISSETVINTSSGLFYQSFGNDLYLLNYTDGTIEKAAFYDDDERYYIISISRSSNDNLIITMKYKNPDTGEELLPKLYYVNLSDFNFS